MFTRLWKWYKKVICNKHVCEDFTMWRTGRGNIWDWQERCCKECGRMQKRKLG
jgi:hypothetical protein